VIREWRRLVRQPSDGDQTQIYSAGTRVRLWEIKKV